MNRCAVERGPTCLVGKQSLVLARPYQLDSLAMTDFANKVDNDVVLLDADSIEVLAHSQGQAIFVLSTGLFLAHHGRRIQADAGLF